MGDCQNEMLELSSGSVSIPPRMSFLPAIASWLQRIRTSARMAFVWRMVAMGVGSLFSLRDEGWKSFYFKGEEIPNKQCPYSQNDVIGFQLEEKKAIVTKNSEVVHVQELTSDEVEYVTHLEFLIS